VSATHNGGIVVLRGSAPFSDVRYVPILARGIIERCMLKTAKWQDDCHEIVINVSAA
jgi:hypothetical protein